MQTLIEYVKSGAQFDNDIIVVFTEDLDKSYGAYAFFNLFKGLDDVTERAVAGISLDAYGNAGTLALTDASGALVPIDTSVRPITSDGTRIALAILLDPPTNRSAPLTSNTMPTSNKNMSSAITAPKKIKRPLPKQIR